jgi:hypothetical protein
MHPEVSRAMYMNSPLGKFFQHAPSRRHRSRPPKGAGLAAAEEKKQVPFKKGKKQE